MLFLLIGGAASAATLTTHLTVDNTFSLYLSPTDSALGTLVGTGNDWGTTYTFSAALTPGVSEFIHVVGVDLGPPAAYIGDFSVDTTAFSFLNGGQSLNTGTAFWGSNATGFGNPYSTPVDEGANGVGPWGLHPAISASAHWIWDAGGAGGTAYFSTQLVAAPAAAPEPGTLVLLGLGAALCGLRKLRK